ncbi:MULTISPECIES: enoyl-CoA hydratase [unclassified Psychrobacillus]|uniref:enoyl-CoA hydratase n=1 Tax=unclassified Psychrobacillus TaxID=2636677 RepID=UPI00146C1ED8|nr:MULTISPECIES: enoyl-CoA hydratase [unclassified Psychrobacillus]MCM3357725.1 enoyl-CoA hydratase [Psychrobacillus sp. MER TA 171]NME07403.1 enoyl-CoA hydratase [Psychrobacillus sp. BL-248-WT-3]
MEFLSWNVENHVATVTLNRPPANALARGVILEVNSLLDEVEHDDNVRVILLKGEGRFFSAGADIKEFTTVTSGEEFSKLASSGQTIFERVETFSKPIIAAIHGAALGGGLELAMSCHIRLVAENAKLGLPELQLGLIPGFAGTQRLPRYVGFAKAAEMLLTSDPISGKDAAVYGLANHAYPEEELFEKAGELAAKIAKKSPVAVKAALEMLQYVKPASYHEGVKAEANAFGTVFVSEDAKEGISAFIEKRQPDFKGK